MKQFNALDLYDILCAQDVKRWTIINTARQQSVAEHTFNVIAIARRIAAMMDLDDTKIIKYAFDHDLDEVMTSDIPKTAKDDLGIKCDYGGVSKSRCSTMELQIVKIADAIETAWFIDHYGIGPRAAEATHNCNTRLYKLVKAADEKVKDVMVPLTCELRGHKHDRDEKAPEGDKQ